MQKRRVLKAPWVLHCTEYTVTELLETPCSFGRHYGALQGRNKASLEEVMGPIVVEWRRGYSTPPPPMKDSHPHWPLITFDSRYRGVTIPETESLADTEVRVR